MDEYRISPVPEPGKERPDYLKPAWLAGVAPLDPVKWLPELKTQKVRVQFVKTVAITPVEAQQKIEAAVRANVDRSISRLGGLRQLELGGQRL